MLTCCDMAAHRGGAAILSCLWQGTDRRRRTPHLQEKLVLPQVQVQSPSLCSLGAGGPPLSFAAGGP